MGTEGHGLLLSGQLLLIPTALLERKVGLSSGDPLMCQNNLEELPTVQWLRLCTAHAGGTVSLSGLRTKNLETGIFM